ncbi:MAG: muconate/chloromuconate family cycloisomerase [Conexivisphaerales archaeon]
MRISAVDTFMISIPVEPENLSFGRIDRVDYVIVRVEAGKFLGYGEAATLQGPTWSEESMETIKIIIDRYLSKIVVGADTSDYLPVSDRMNEKVKGNNFAKAAVEMAVIDAYCKELGMPVYSLIGGKFRDSIPLSWTIANNDPELDAREASDRVRKGWRILKIKMGSLPLEKDLERVRIIKDAVGGKASIRVDINQGWTVTQTLASLGQLAKAGVDLIEQPLPRWDMDGLALVARKSSIPIMADESVCTVQDALELIRRRAASVFSYKLTKMGGLMNSRAIHSVAKAFGIPGYIGCMIETSVGTAAYLHFGASVSNLEFGCELFGPLRIRGDIVKDGIEYSQGEVKIPSGPGFGVEIDWKKVQKYEVNIS